MKNVMVCFLILCIILVFASPASASELAVTEDEMMLVNLIKEQYADQVTELLDQENFAETLSGVDLTCPMLLVCEGALQWVADMESLEDMAACCKNPHNNFYIIVFETIPFKLSAYSEGSKISIKLYEQVPSYIRDIQNGTVCQTFLDIEYRILRLYLFNELYLGTSVVYETDGGIFVRYYESDKAQAIEYSWGEFKEYSLAYQAYIREIMYDENGNLVGGDSPSFVHFVEEYKAQKEAERQAELRQKTILYISIGAGATVLCAGTATILLLRRRKKRQTTEE